MTPPNTTIVNGSIAKDQKLCPSELSSGVNPNLRILIIDNFDSYTFNIYQLFAQFLNYPPVVIHNNQFTWTEMKETVLPHFDAVILSPGPGHPENPKDFGICTQVISECQLPILGICLGHQGIGLYFGGKVVKAPVPMHGRINPVEHTGMGVFRNIPSPFMCTRYHSLVVHEEELPSCLIPTAWVYDPTTSRKLIMGLQHKTKPMFGVQFHPESICSEHGAVIASNFCQLSSLVHTTSNASFTQWSTEASILPCFHSLPIMDVPISGQWKGFVQQIEWVDPNHLAQVWNSIQGNTMVWIDSAAMHGSARWSYLCGLSPTR